jgi:hypothetical protein
MISVYCRQCLSRKAFYNWARNSLKDVRKSQMEPNKVALLRLRQKQLCSGWKEFIRADRRIKLDSVATAQGCSHVLAYSIMHGSFEVEESERTVITHRIDGSRKS